MPRQTRALERALVCQLAQAKLQPIVEEYVDRWIDARELGKPAPDMLDLVEAAAKDEVPLLTINVLDRYLQDCRSRGAIPNERRVIETIVHGFAESPRPQRQNLQMPRPHPPPRPRRLYAQIPLTPTPTRRDALPSFPRRREPTP